MLATAIYQLKLMARAVPGHYIGYGAAHWRLDARVPSQILKRVTSLRSYRSCVRTCKLVAYDAGRIVECGNHAALQAVNGRYADMWSMQQQASQWIIDEIGFYCSTCMDSLLLITS